MAVHPQTLPPDPVSNPLLSDRGDQAISPGAPRYALERWARALRPSARAQAALNDNPAGCPR